MSSISPNFWAQGLPLPGHLRPPSRANSGVSLEGHQVVPADPISGFSRPSLARLQPPQLSSETGAFLACQALANSDRSLMPSNDKIGDGPGHDGWPTPDCPPCARTVSFIPRSLLTRRLPFMNGEPKRTVYALAIPWTILQPAGAASTLLPYEHYSITTRLNRRLPTRMTYALPHANSAPVSLTRS